MGSTDDTSLTVPHIPHEPHTPDDEPTVTQQVDNLLEGSVSYLSWNNLIVHPTKSVPLIKGAARAPTVSPEGRPLNVVEATTLLGVSQTADCDDISPPAKLQSPPANVHPYASPPTKALTLSHQGLAYYVTGVKHLNRHQGTSPNTSHHRSPTSHTRHHQGTGGTRRLAHLNTHPSHLCCVAPLWVHHTR